MNKAKQLASFCDEITYDDLPEATIQRAKEFLLDASGIAIAATQTDFNDLVFKAIQDLGHLESDTSSCIIWGTESSTTPEYAAFLNGTGIHTLEADDTHSKAIVHPGASVIPAAVATAESIPANGKDLLTGLVVGYEVACLLGRSLPAERHREYGFHPTATCGLFGAIAAVGTVSNADPETITNAFGIAVSQVSGVLQWKSNSAWNKRIHPGLAAKNAIFCNTLARQGFRGASKPFTGTFGFFSVYTDDPQPNILIEEWGSRFEILQTDIKPYACCRLIHPIIEATISIVTKHEIDSDDIEAIHVDSYDAVCKLCSPTGRKTRPETVVDAQFSPQYVTAIAVHDREVLVDQFCPDCFSDPGVLRLIDNITITEDTAMSKRFPAEWSARVRIKTNQRTFTTERSIDSDRHQRQYEWNEINEKFNKLTDGIIPCDRQKQTAKRIAEIGTESNISQFTQLLTL